MGHDGCATTGGIARDELHRVADAAGKIVEHFASRGRQRWVQIEPALRVFGVTRHDLVPVQPFPVAETQLSKGLQQVHGDVARLRNRLSGLLRATKVAAEDMREVDVRKTRLQVFELSSTLRAERRIGVSTKSSCHVRMSVTNQHDCAVARHCHTPHKYTAISAS